MKIQLNSREKGQSLVVLAILLIVFLAFVALALDGGNTYVRRRQAQTAADAGALAGARQLCETESPSAAIAAAEEYAVTRNGADSAAVTVLVDDSQVQVDTIITFNTFLAHLIGRPEMEVQATATAECQIPASVGPGANVLPSAWACKPPINGNISSSEDCQQQAITQETLNEYLNNPPPECSPICPELYIVMNSDNTGTEYCISDENPAGPIDCDFDNDGEMDLFPSGDRSWLNLDGGNNSSAAVGWIEDGIDFEVFIHTWYPGNPGTTNNVFSAVETKEGEILVVPVFDALCDNLPSDGGYCSTEFHNEDGVVPGPGGGQGQNYFHITAFSLFYVTCVDNGGQDQCDGHDVAEANGMPGNEKTIEGYFIQGTLPGFGGGGGGSEVGTYVLFLIK